MAWTNERKGGSYTPPPFGAHFAVCVGVYEIGTQTQTYQGKSRKAEKVVLVFELPWALKDDGTPITTSEFYTLSLYEKARLRQHLNGWYGRVLAEDECRSFDPHTLLGAWAQIIVGPRGNGKTEISNILHPGDLSQYQLPSPVNTPKFFSVHQWNQEIFESFSERMQTIVMESEEYQQQFAHQFQANPAPAPAAPPAGPRPAVGPGGPQGGPRPMAAPISSAPAAAAPAAAPTAPAAPPVPTAPQPGRRPAGPSGPGQRPPVPAPTAPGVEDDDIPF